MRFLNLVILFPLVMLLCKETVNEAERQPVPVITLDPRDTSLVDGSEAFFTIAVEGNIFGIQWYKNDTVLIRGGDEFSYSIRRVRFADSGSTYKCVVGNQSGYDTSNAAILHVTKAPPSITRNPSNDTVSAGSSGRFNVRANGSDLIYQWQKNNVNLTDTNATKRDYRTPPVAITNSGELFRCIAINSAGADTSEEAMLVVNP